jgi:hypothetical protein
MGCIKKLLSFRSIHNAICIDKYLNIALRRREGPAYHQRACSSGRGGAYEEWLKVHICELVKAELEPPRDLYICSSPTL